MASTRMMTKASEDFRQTATALQTATGEEAAELREKAAKIGQWLESAMLGCSDRDCEWASDYSPAPRRIRRSTRQLREVAA